MNKQSYIFVSIFALMSINSLFGVIVGFKNKSRCSQMKVQVMGKDNVCIDHFELDPREFKLIVSKFKDITRIIWQLEGGLYQKTVRYQLDVDIQWYYVFGGVFKLYGDGSYNSTFFGDGKIEGTKRYFWEK